MVSPPTTKALPDFLSGGGEMSALMHAMDWTTTKLGRSSFGRRVSEPLCQHMSGVPLPDSRVLGAGLYSLQRQLAARFSLANTRGLWARPAARAGRKFGRPSDPCSMASS
jgi:hypothetical protein